MFHYLEFGWRYGQTGGTTAQTTNVELYLRFVAETTRAAGNNRRWTGNDGLQAGRQMSTQGGWQADTGLVIMEQGEHRL